VQIRGDLPISSAMRGSVDGDVGEDVGFEAASPCCPVVVEDGWRGAEGTG
jgi:hypothetical protein